MSNFNFSLEPGKHEKISREYVNHKNVISVITPTWNPTKLLYQTAASILNQTYPYFEWLIIDDGSTKKESLEILEQIKNLDNRIKVLHKQNEGLSKTRDYGVHNSSKETELVVFIDDDDLLEHTYLECAYYTMCTNKGASWAYCDVVNFEGIQSLWSQHFSCQRMKEENLLVSQAMVRKSAFYDVGGFELDGNGHYEDWIFWLKLMAKGHYPVHMSFYGFWYRRKNNSGQLKLAMSNHKKNMNEIKKYAKEIKKDVYPIEYPKEDYNWDEITEKVDNLIVPQFKKDKKINILAIIPWMIVGGADKFNLDLFSRIDKNKYNITVLTTQPMEYVWRQQFEEVCDEVFDLSTFLNRKDWLSFVNYIIDTRNINIIFNTNSQTGYMMLPYLHAKYPSIPILDYVHMEEWYNRNGGYSRDSASVGSVIDKTLFCNQNSENIIINHFNRKPNTVDTVYIGVDADKFNPDNYNKKELRNKYGIDSKQFVISLIARIDYQKRPFLLMEIIKEVVRQNKIKNILFVIAGDGPLLNDIKKIAKQNKLNKYIKFLGKTSTPDEIYAISDMTLNCSIKEGLALTSYESLSMGVPVVSADVGGQKELINDETGVIVPCLQKENEIHNFNYQIEEVNNYVNGIHKISKDINKYKKACRKRILERFTIENMITNMEEIFENAIKVKHEKTDIDKHIDILKELLSQYFIADKKEYQYYCGEYNLKMYGYNHTIMSEKKYAFISKCNQIGIKLHIPVEFDIIMRQGFDIVKNLIIFTKSLISIIKSLVTLVVKLLTRIFLRVYNVIKKVLKK